MAERQFNLQSCTQAIIESEEAIHLIEQKERLEQAIAKEDAPLTLDMAKAFLESVLKTVLTDREENPDLAQDLGPLYRSVRSVVPFNRDNNAQDIIQRLGGSIVHQVAELRNRFGAASHGDDGYYDNPIEMPEAELVVRCVDGLAALIYRKHRQDGNPELLQRIYYSDYREFNDFLDGQYEGYHLPISDKQVIDLNPSEILFRIDPEAYREMLLQYMATEEEDTEEE